MKKKTSTTKKQIILIVLSIVLVILIAVSAVIAYAWFNKPEDKSGEFGDLPTLPKETTDEVLSSETNDDDNNQTDSSPTTQKGVYNFLLLCKDRVGLNTDVMIIINFNTDSKKITVLQIPRDTYIGLDSYQGKINGLYAHYYMQSKNKGDKNPTTSGLREMCKTLQYNMYMPLQGGVVLNLEGFCNIVDILGGVTVNVPADMKYVDESQNLYINLKKGIQVLDGDKAEQFVRFRSGYVAADLGRMDAQKIFMSALLKKVKSSFNVETIVKLANQVIEHVTIDNISTLDIISYAKCLLEMDLENINFVSMPGLNAGAAHSWCQIMVRKNMYEIINENFNIYETDIPEELFDVDRVFTTREENTKINELYSKEDYEDDGLYSADDINDGAITIPRV